MVAFKAVLAFATLALPAVQAGHIHARHDHSHVSRSALPGKWYHDDNHPAHKLFVRGPAPAGPPAFAPIGSPTWSANFPKGTPDASQLPKAWTDALNAAVAAGRIPNIPQTTSVDAGPPVYPTGFDPNSPQVCSAYYHTCRNKEDIYDAPDGFLGTSFDDGPLPDQVTLNNFLAQNNEKTTYFLIGVNMLAHPDILQATIDQGHDIAVHTWTHPQMTTLANIDVLAQLGWSVELIRNSTGGKIPRYWRPPTGDSDERVRAIAKEIFGLTTVIWNHDTFDWSLTQANGVTPPEIHANYTQWLAGPKSPGLVILEHVLSTGSVQAFIDAYPLVKQAGWKTGSLIKLTGDGSAFQTGVTAVIANPATIVRPSTTGVTVLAPPATSSPTVLPAPVSTSVVVVKPSTTSAATPAPSGNGAVATPARIFGSASVVVLTYLFSLLL